MTIASGHIIRAAARHRWNSTDDIVNVYHFLVETIGGTPSDEAGTEDLSELITAAYSSIEANMTTRVSQEDITMYNVSLDAPLPTVNWFGSYSGGTSVGDSLPSQVSPLVLWRTGVKRTLGKTYLPPFSEASQEGGIWIPAVLVNVATFAALLRDNSSMGNGYVFRLVVWKRSIGDHAEITGVNQVALAATQRRRRAGTGS